MDKSLEDPLQEWELLPDNTSFFQFGLHEIPDLISNEIIYSDYFIQAPNPLPQTPPQDQDEEPQFKNITISHIFLNTIKQQPDEKQQLRSRSDQAKKSGVELLEIEIEIEIEKVGFGEKGDLEEEKEVWDGMWMWRWRVMGVGALFSIGAAAAAAATICVVVLGGGAREGKRAARRRRRERFFSNDEDKGVNRVVEHASRLNQGLAAARGTPTMMRAAKISFGGCYDSL